MKQAILPFLLAALVAIISSTSEARWADSAIEFADQNFAQFPGPKGLSKEESGHLATLWGGGNRNLKSFYQHDEIAYQIKLPEYFAKPIEVDLALHTRTFGTSGEIRVLKAPLFVYVPGVFSNADEAPAQAIMRRFQDMGYHVLSVPNCWGRDFYSARPTYNAKYPDSEANVVIEMTKWAIKEIGEENVGEIHIGGESLGALTAQVAFTMDARSAKPMFESVTLLWPPVSLYSAIQSLDSTLKRTDKQYESKCLGLINKIKTKLRVLQGRILRTPTSEEVDCAPALVSQYAFRKELRKLAKTINKAKLEATPVLTFENFISDFAPRYSSALSSKDRNGQLGYWIAKTPSEKRRKIRVLTSDDDFLNVHENWSDVGLSRSQLIVAPWGGHIGLTNTKAFRGFLKAQFSLK